MESGFVSEIIKTIAAQSPVVRNDDDYIGEDGLLYCGTCGERKEKAIRPNVLEDKVIKVHCLCKCERDQRDLEQKEQLKREALEKTKRMRDTSLMDRKLSTVTFSNLTVTEDNKKNIGLCQKYAKSFDRMMEKNQGLLFWGPVGTGKSYAAACIANELIENGISVVMTSFVKLLEIIENRDNHEAEEDIIKRINTSKLVIFDDLGAERGSNYSLEKMYNILDSRYRAGQPMIVTTNLTLERMMKETDERYSRIYDRIFEVCYPVHWIGQSWRKQQANKRFKEMERFLEAEL